MISDASNKTESFQDQLKRVQQSAKLIAEIIAMGHSVIVTHGNGPQVGSLLLQQQADVEGSVNLPLRILGALTQGQIGVVLQHALIAELATKEIDQQVIVIPTTVIVDQHDPGFSAPSKPIGPFYSNEEYEQLDKDPDYHYVSTPKGYRRIVASPDPKEVLEINQIMQLSRDNLIIAGGGGGTPAIRCDGHLEMKDAVIDKDLASALLASEINADLLMILTNVDGVYLNFNKSNQELLADISHSYAKELIQDGQVGRGNMEPKLKAGVRFTTGQTIITSPEHALDALRGKAGTRIIN